MIVKGPVRKLTRFEDTGLPSIPSIFGTPLTTASAMKVEACFHDGALQQPSIELDQEEE